jgi:hypothetical protein
MAEREDLELQRGTAPKGGERCGQKGGQEVSEGESKEKGQLPVYQSDRILREPQSEDGPARSQSYRVRILKREL